MVKGNQAFDLCDRRDIKKLNVLLNRIGIHFEYNLYDPYVWIEMDRFQVFLKRNAGRRTVITTDLRHKVFTLRFEKASIRAIAKDTGISTATVRKILEEYELPLNSDQQSLEL